MNKVHEIQKLRNILQIPISDIAFVDSAVRLIDGNYTIGHIPYHNMGNGIIGYETDRNARSRLKWDSVYDNHKLAILTQIKQCTGIEDPHVAICLMPEVFVRQYSADTPIVFVCIYEESKWRVIERK